MKMLRVVPLALVLALAACASAPSEDGAAPTAGGSTTLITRAEIESINVPSAYELVQRLRPRWLRSRGAGAISSGPNEVVVFQGNTLLGGIESLRDFAPSTIESLRYLDGQRASTTLPGLAGRLVDGAIILEMRHVNR